MKTHTYIHTEIYSSHEKMRNSAILLSANLLFILTAFPYISPVNMGFDTQPNALLFSFLICAFALANGSAFRMPMPLIGLLFILLYASFLFIISPDKLTAARSLAGYATLFFVTFASYQSVKHVKIKWFNFSVYTWFFFGLIQLTVSKLFGSFLLPRMTTTYNRGVTSLAVEPSYYAVVCVFLLVLNDIFQSVGKQNKKKHFLIMALLIFQILITLSGMGLLFLFIYFMGKILAIVLREGIKKHLPKLLLFIFVALVSFVSFRTIDVLKLSRGGEILEAVLANPMVLILSDSSLAERLTHILIPLYSLFYSSGIGLGLGAWSDHFWDISHYAGGLVQEISQVSSTFTNRIMSGWGSAIYELGVFGVFLMLIFIRAVLRGAKQAKSHSSVFISSGFTILILMSMAVPLAFPLFGYVLGMYLYYGRPQNTDKKDKIESL